MNLLDEIIDKEQKEINKINERIKQIKDDIIQKKDELELITGRVCKITKKGKIDLRSIKLDTEQQKAFDIIQKRKSEERKLKRANEFHEMIKNCLTQIANERNNKTVQVETPKPIVFDYTKPIDRKRW